MENRLCEQQLVDFNFTTHNHHSRSVGRALEDEGGKFFLISFSCSTFFLFGPRSHSCLSALYVSRAISCIYFKIDLKIPFEYLNALLLAALNLLLFEAGQFSLSLPYFFSTLLNMLLPCCRYLLCNWVSCGVGGGRLSSVRICWKTKNSLGWSKALSVCWNQSSLRCLSSFHRVWVYFVVVLLRLVVASSVNSHWFQKLKW